MNKVLIIYDDSAAPKYDISSIIGNKSFGEIVYKRKTLKERFFEATDKSRNWKTILEIHNKEDQKQMQEKFELCSENTIILHLFSSYVITNEEKYLLLLEKAPYTKEIIMLQTSSGTAGFIFPNLSSYQKCMRTINDFAAQGSILETDAFCNMNQLSDFLQYITGGFDARYFNSLKGGDYTVTKSSNNKKKIKSEYTYYHLLPDYMKRWYVLPYEYKENGDMASYTMERLHMTDVAIRWVHGAFSKEEFDHMLDKIFYFVEERKKKKIPKASYTEEAQKLYQAKVYERIEELKRHEKYYLLSAYIENGTRFDTIDSILSYYEKAFQSVRKLLFSKEEAVIGHGDLCFSNILYNKETQTLKFIDVKGALKEEELWTNPYYDLAKLSHSICGRYDFFNNDMYEIRMNPDLKLELNLDFDNREFVDSFKRHLKNINVDYTLVRVLEASLFLSMLPLHMDNPRKVFGFLLNAINILDEVKHE